MANGNNANLGWKVSTAVLALVSVIVVPISMRTWGITTEVSATVNSIDTRVAVIEGNRYTSMDHLQYALEMAKELSTVWEEIRTIQVEVKQMREMVQAKHAGGESP